MTNMWAFKVNVIPLNIYLDSFFLNVQAFLESFLSGHLNYVALCYTLSGEAKCPDTTNYSSQATNPPMVNVAILQIEHFEDTSW